MEEGLILDSWFLITPWGSKSRLQQDINRWITQGLEIKEEQYKPIILAYQSELQITCEQKSGIQNLKFLGATSWPFSLTQYLDLNHFVSNSNLNFIRYFSVKSGTLAIWL